MALTVTAELIQVQDEATGASHTLTKGAPLPSSVSADQVKHLKELGFVGEPQGEGDESKSSTSRKSSK